MNGPRSWPVRPGKVEMYGAILDSDGDFNSHATIELDPVVVKKVHMAERALRQASNA